MAKNKFDISQYQLIANYIESGSTGSLNDDQIEYLDILCKMNTMRRKFGMEKTVSFFVKQPYAIPAYRAKEMFFESINLFYADDKADRKALRNLKAQQLENAAELVMATAKTAQDIEIYANIIKQSWLIRGLDQPDPIEMPKGVYDKPIKVYSLDSKVLNVDKANRDQLGKLIDLQMIPESDKRRLKQEAMIEEINFIELLDDQKNENSE